MVKQSQASQQEVGEDLAGWDMVPAEEVWDNDEVDAVEDFTAKQSTSVSSQWSNMLDQILFDMKSKAKNTTTEDTMISNTSNPLTMQKKKLIPTLDILLPELNFWVLHPGV